MPRNRRSPGLLRSTARTAARTAVIAGTATATSNAVHNRMDPQASSSTVAQPQPAQVAYVPQPVAQSVPAAAAPADLVAQLAQLAELKAVGALTEDEFQQAKSKLLI